jgi:hypothetical protein
VTTDYAEWADKGEVAGGVRLTVMSAPVVSADELVQVVHVVEHTEPGAQVYVMGPKPVYGEYVDGRLATASPPAGEDPLAPLLYDGPVLPGPHIDSNYEITSYHLPPGEHEIRWEFNGRRSNLLRVRVD